MWPVSMWPFSCITGWGLHGFHSPNNSLQHSDVDLTIYYAMKANYRCRSPKNMLCQERGKSRDGCSRWCQVHLIVTFSTAAAVASLDVLDDPSHFPLEQPVEVQRATEASRSVTQTTWRNSDGTHKNIAPNSTIEPLSPIWAAPLLFSAPTLTLGLSRIKILHESCDPI